MIGQRVRHCREFCALTQTQLADLTGLPQSKISEIEAGRDVRPSAKDIALIAFATGFPASFFHQGPLPDMPNGNFRRLKRGKAQVTRQVRAQARQLVELTRRAEGLIQMPNVSLRPLVTVVDIEAIAQDVRHEVGIGDRDPIPNLTRALERAGVVVARLPGEIPDHSGFSVWDDYGLGGRPLIVYSLSLPGDRQRFTIAHELGHLMLHSPDRDSVLEPQEAEREANRFAGAILLPHDAAVDALRPPLTLTTLAHVKASFGISIGAGAQRALDLGLISEDRYISLRKQLTSRGWHHNEPVEVPNEHPMLIRKMLEPTCSGRSLIERADNLQLPVFAYRAFAI